MAAVLSEFLSEAAKHRFAWGARDCMLFAADWCHAQVGKDPAASFRGRYASAAEAQTLMDEAGGAEHLIDAALAAIGWQRIEGARAGAIVMAHLPRIEDAVCGIALDAKRIAFCAERGIVVWPGRVVAAWGPAHG